MTENQQIPSQDETPPVKTETTPAPAENRSKYDPDHTASIIGRQDTATIQRTLEKLASIRPELIPKDDYPVNDAPAKPKVEDSSRIAALETELARTRSIAKYGLPEDVANMLKGTPSEIDALAQVLGTHIKAGLPVPNPQANAETTNTSTPEPPRPNEPAPVYVERSVPGTQGIPPHEAMAKVTQRLEEIKAEGGLDMFRDIARRRIE